MTNTVTRKRKNFTVKHCWLAIYVFIAIFQPPILPFPLIYVAGFFTALLLIIKYRERQIRIVLKYSGLSNLITIIAFLVLYFAFISLIDLFFGDYILIDNRARCINQLLVLQAIQIVEITYIISLSKELGLNTKKLLLIVIFAGFLQGLCCIAAYIFPSIRQLFTLFADKELFNNAYFVERRGYGFSSTLIDTFGYGMGLLCGYLILSKLSKRFLIKLLCIAIIVFCIVVNARTGIVIIAIGIAIKLLQARTITKFVKKALIAIPILCLIVFWLVPLLLDFLGRSSNVTIQWVINDFRALYDSVFSSGNIVSSLGDLDFLSSFDHMPANLFSVVFGTGHSIYGSSKELGFHSDVGYVNLIWEIGIVGTVVFLTAMFVWMFNPFLKTKDMFLKSVVVFNVLSYFAVLFKAILIGYNPGIFITLFVTSLFYCETNNFFVASPRLANQNKSSNLKKSVSDGGTISPAIS